jgi:large subunit ribosomal protein L4e
MGKATTKIFDLDGKAVGKLKVPKVFKIPLRPDVIKRAVVTLQSHRFQPQGRDPQAGTRRSVESLGSGHGLSRFPRLKAGGQRAVFAVGTVGGRRANPPVVEKKISKKIPHKEMRLALRSALAATASKQTVTSRGHMAEDVKDFPLVVVDDIQDLKKTSEVETAFIKLGVWPDIYRVKESFKERAGKGKRRGRKTKHAVGPLLVIAEDKGVAQAARNLPGVDISTVNNLNAELLAPGTHPGRLTIWTKSAFEKLDEIFSEGG